MDDKMNRANMLERGVFEANGYKFTVKPVYLCEEDQYLTEITYALYPRVKEGQEPSEKDLSHFAMMLFRNEGGEIAQQGQLGMCKRFKRWFAKTILHNYEYYSDNPSALAIAKWVERKVYYKKRHVKFYDLERKFGLSKSEIVKLLGFFQDLSGF